MDTIQAIKIWGQTGPNPPKIAMIAEEIDLPYEIISISLIDVKEPGFLEINPNGRIPAIYDHNTNLTLWESGAIIEYLIWRYDTNRKLSYVSGSNDDFRSKQWLYFQVSGQGPYYGQTVWFKKYHPEHVPSALNRYLREMERITSVLDGHLKKQRERYRGEPWLVGHRITYADIAFVTYQHLVPAIVSEELKPFDLDRFSEVSGWIARLTGRSTIKKVLGKMFQSDAASQVWMVVKGEKSGQALPQEQGPGYV